ncbi:MAG: gliding motility lipoprotein GldD [Marinifilaceae bacterium]|jgi:gliding motility-associated lipoprotein GldD|nr:gliding motility lipoprotein GldD [Marinifilaceae bacterium]
MQKIIISIILSLIFVSCSNNYTPKPKAYFRIDFNEPNYKQWDKKFPYKFMLNSDAEFDEDKEVGAESYWANIKYPKYNATIHLSYKKIENNLDQYWKDAKTMTYKHSVKASSINQQAFVNKEQDVFAILYSVKGNVASSYQFAATDSVNHFIRGALYFNSHSNYDSLRPVIDYIGKDIVKLLESLEWNK